MTVLALSLVEGAYASEIFRSGILSVERGQIEAAENLGLNRYQIFRLIVLPQAIRTVLEPLTSQAISLIEASALVSTIATYDLSLSVLVNHLEYPVEHLQPAPGLSPSQ